MTWADTLKRAVISVGLVLACGPHASALDSTLDVGQYAHNAWRFRDGFAQGQVTAIAQTPDGYLWLGTEFGLLRFDGVRSVPWSPPGADRLPSSWIRSLLATRDGTLWIGTLEGLASWADGTLTSYPDLAGQSVNALLEDRAGTIWAGGYAGGIGRVLTSTATLCTITNGRTQCRDGDFGQWVGALHEGRNGDLWATAETGLWRLRPGAPTRYATPEAAGRVLQTLNEDRDGRLLIAAEGAILQLVDGKAVPYSLPGAQARFKPQRLLHDRDGGLWIGTLDRGLLHVHQGRTDVYTEANGLSGDFITRLFEDREGNIWVATRKGLDRFRELAVRTISTNQGLQSAAPWSVLAVSDGSVWVGTMDGVSRWHAGQVTTYRTPAQRPVSSVQLATDGARRREILDSGLPDDRVGSLFEDRAGRVWVSTLRGVAYFANGRFVPVSELPAGRTSVMAGDSAGNIWIANDAHGLFRVRGETVVDSIAWDALGLSTPPTALLPDSKHGGLWLGLHGRVAYLEDRKIRASYAVADGLGDGRVNDLRADASGAVWVSMERGLSRIKNGRVATVTGSNDLPCDNVHWSMEDSDRLIWLYMTCGLVRIAPEELDAALIDPTRRIVTREFGASDGVGLRATAALYRPQVARTADGRLWFLPGDGVSVLDARNISINTLPPPVHIERIMADRRTFDLTSGLELPALTRDLEIDYTALSFVAPEKNRFRVKLEGRDLEWRDVGNRRQVFYTDLSPGAYRFRVAASNNSGVWNETGGVLDFSVAPAYYQTRWFQAACLLTALALCWAVYQFRLRQLAHDFNLRLDERVHERTRIARELHDTLLQSFHGLILRFQSVRDLLPANPDKAVQALDGALDRADQAITEGRDAIQNLRSSATAGTTASGRTASGSTASGSTASGSTAPGSPAGSPPGGTAGSATGHELTEAFTVLAEELGRRPDGAKGSAIFRMSVEGRPRALHPIVRDDIHHIGREALRNAFRHAGATLIEADVTYGARELRLRIRDNGKGIDPAHLHAESARHWGLTGMRERAVQIGARLDVWSEAGAGTEVELRIPGALAYRAPRGDRHLLRMLRMQRDGS